MDTSPEELEAALLAVRCQLGERGAFDDLIRRWAPPLRAHVGRVVGEADAADDLMQEIWLNVIQGIGRLREPARLRAWLFGIAHRRTMDWLRRRYGDAGAHGSDPDETAASDPAPDRQIESRELAQGLMRLPAVEREILSLFYLDELPQLEIALALDLPLGTVKSRLFRARNLLRQLLTGDDHD